MAAQRRKGRNDNTSANSNGAPTRTGPFLIGVAGGTASGKSTVCDRIMEQFSQEGTGDKRVLTMSLESFYHILSEEEHKRATKGQYNFDHPSAFDEEYLLTTLKDIKSGKTVTISEYDKVNNCRSSDKTQVITSADVILCEGILTFYFKELLPLFDMKLFVDTDADTRLSRRVLRDTNRGRELDQVLHQYTTFVKPAFEEFCLPSKKYADVIMPRGADNEVAIELIVQHIRDLLHPTSAPRVCLRQNSDSLFCFPNPQEKDHSYVSAH